MCLLEEIPTHKKAPAHQHIDMIYVAKPLGNINPICPDPIQWFALEEVEGLKSDEEIFAETQEVIGHLLKEEKAYEPIQ